MLFLRDTNFTLNKKMRSIFLLASILIFTSCKKLNYECEYEPKVYQKYSFKIGSAVDLNYLNSDAQYENILNETFNSITAENVFKFEYLHPENGVYNFIESDQIALYATNNNKRLHGHTLIWHNQLPTWLIDFQGNRNEWIELMRDHIQTVVSHFKGQAVSWDVVNEALNEDGSLRNSIWKQKIGNDYIELAFRFAHEADENALLFYNDYSLESNKIKRKAAIELINNLKLHGVKIDGIGIQMHVALNQPNASEIANTFQDFAKYNLLIHLSELDISVNLKGNVTEFSDDLFKKQANYFHKILKHYKQVPETLQYGITFWGVSDANSWIPSFFQREDYPLLFDKNYNIKPMFCILNSDV